MLFSRGKGELNFDGRNKNLVCVGGSGVYCGDFSRFGGGGGSGMRKFLTGGVGDLSSLPVGKTLLCASWSYNVMVFPMILSVVLMFSLVILATTESAI